MANHLQNPDSAAGHVLDRLREVAKTVPQFAASVAVDGRSVCEVNPDLELCACSTTKVAAATAVLSLVQEGRVDLDAVAMDVDPRLTFRDVARGGRITIRMLLSHTSGLSDTDRPEEDPLGCLPSLRHVADPGRVFCYSNVGFVCGVIAAARQVDQTYQSLIEQRVIKPLEMTSTRWRAELGFNSFVTTTRDLTRLAYEQLGGGKVLASETLAEMRRVHGDSYAAGAARYYGLGLVIEDWDGLELYSHGGGLNNFGSAFLLDGGARASVAMMFDHPAGYAMSAHQCLDELLGRATSSPARTPLPVDWREWLGRYANGAELLDVDGKPHLTYAGIRNLALELFDENVLVTSKPVRIPTLAPSPISVGLVPGEPRMIVLNHFPPIGARPGRRLES